MMLKNFQTYIFELSKPSEFRIKLAGINPVGEVMDKIKAALETFQLESISAVKSHPIQEHREFPNWGGPCECWQFDVKLAYPTTNIVIMQTLKERAQLNPNWINVRNLNEANYTDEAENLGKDQTGALLDEPELKDVPGAQSLVGHGRITSLIAELEKHTRKFEVAGNDLTDGDKVVTTGKTTNDLPQGDVAPVGTKQNTVYRGTKGMKTK